MHNKLVLLHYPPTVNWLPIDWLITFPSAPLPPPSLVNCKLGYISHPSLSLNDLDIIQFAYCHSIDFSRKMFAQKMVAVVVIRRQPLIWAAAIILDLPTYICGEGKLYGFALSAAASKIWRRLGRSYGLELLWLSTIWPHLGESFYLLVAHVLGYY